MSKKRSAKRTVATTAKPSDLEGLHYAILEEWVNTGQSSKLDPEMELYLRQLQTVNGLWSACNSPQMIISKLCLAYPSLNKLTAKSRLEDATVFFYLDDGIKIEAFSNMIADKKMQLAAAIVQSAKDAKDYKLASDVYHSAWIVKGGDKPKPPEIPEDALQKPINIFSSDVTKFVDIPQDTSRNALGAYIDEMNLKEVEKVRIKQDMGVEPKELFEAYVKKEKED